MNPFQLAQEGRQHLELIEVAGAILRRPHCGSSLYCGVRASDRRAGFPRMGQATTSPFGAYPVLDRACFTGPRSGRRSDPTVRTEVRSLSPLWSSDAIKPAQAAFRKRVADMDQAVRYR